MKAELNGVKLEGTPAEIAEVIKLVGVVQEVKATIKWVPYFPTYPTAPAYPYSPLDGWHITATSTAPSQQAYDTWNAWHDHNLDRFAVAPPSPHWF